jgi:site-specific recombinase XerD
MPANSMFSGISLFSPSPNHSIFRNKNGLNRDLDLYKLSGLGKSFNQLIFITIVDKKCLTFAQKFSKFKDKTTSKMSTPMHLSFQLKKSKADETGKAPIYARITINEVRTEFSIKRNVEPDRWLSNAGVVKGTTEESKSINAYLATVRLKLNEHYRLLMEANKPITVETVKNAYLGITEKGKTIIEVFKYHNSQVKELLDKDFSFGTYERYCTALSHTQEFIKLKYKVSDLEIKQINYEFITEFEYFLKTVRKCSHNTAIKYITNFKKIIRICIGNGWLERDPFTNYKITLREVERECLTEAELDVVAAKEFSTQRLEQVRDIFLFCCFTGLAYSDVKKLSKDHIIMGIDGEKWIKINRTKTDTRSSIPLLPIPTGIIAKYANNPKCKAENRLLPVLTNQKMNGYLKEIADLCGITKNITSHLARHTFATTVTLTNGVPLESVSKMLGHKSVRTTQHYAKIVDRKVSDDMQLLKEKFATNQEKKQLQKASGY